MSKTKKWLIACLSTVLLFVFGWTVRAEIRGFFLSCGLFYIEVPDGLSNLEYAALYDSFELSYCVDPNIPIIEDPPTPLNDPNLPV